MSKIWMGGSLYFSMTGAGAMAGGPKDFERTKELVQLVGPPKAGRTKWLGGPKCKSEQTSGVTKKLNVY